MWGSQSQDSGPCHGRTLELFSKTWCSHWVSSSHFSLISWPGVLTRPPFSSPSSPLYLQVSAINNINAMLAQATSSIRNENDSLLAGKSSHSPTRLQIRETAQYRATEPLCVLLISELESLTGEWSLWLMFLLVRPWRREDGGNQKTTNAYSRAGKSPA